MKQLIDTLGTAAGVAGVLVCVGSGLMRMTGGYYLAGFELTTLFNAGVGMMVFACLAKLEAQSRAD